MKIWHHRELLAPTGGRRLATPGFQMAVDVNSAICGCSHRHVGCSYRTYDRRAHEARRLIDCQVTGCHLIGVV